MAEHLNEHIIAHIKGTEFVRGRVWMRGKVPKNAQYPYCVIDMIGDVNYVLRGDAQDLSQWQQSVQVSLFQKSLKKTVDGQVVDQYDPDLPGNLFRSFKSMAKEFGTSTRHRITVRLRSINDIPQPDEDLVRQSSMTIEVTMSLATI